MSSHTVRHGQSAKTFPPGLINRPYAVANTKKAAGERIERMRKEIMTGGRIRGGRRDFTADMDMTYAVSMVTVQTH